MTVLEQLKFELFPKMPIVLQTETSECGLACLAMILGYYGKNNNLFELRNRYSTSSQGTTLNTLMYIANNCGLITRPLSLELEEIANLRLPCILHWGFNHFVVLVKVTPDYFILHDPAFGKRKIYKKEFSENFTGVALEVWTELRFEKKTTENTIKSYEILKHISGIKGELIKVFSLSMLIELVALLIPIGTQLIMDHVIQAKDESLLLVICFGLFLFTLFRTVIGMLRA